MNRTYLHVRRYQFLASSHAVHALRAGARGAEEPRAMLRQRSLPAHPLLRPRTSQSTNTRYSHADAIVIAGAIGTQRHMMCRFVFIIFLAGAAGETTAK